MSFGTAALGSIALGGASTNSVNLASGFKPTTFGQANVLPGWVPGFRSIAFSTPVGKQHWNATSIGPLIKFSWAQSAPAPSIHSTAFGEPRAYRGSFIGQQGDAVAMVPVVFGTPRAGYRQNGAGTGWRLPSFGTPTALELVHPAALHPVVFGTPSLRVRQVAAGWLASHFGTPVARMRQTATGSLFAPRFGLPEATRSNTYPVTGIIVPRGFGVPTGFSRFNRAATGFQLPHFGTPAVKQRHRVSHIPPLAHFGTPLLQRDAAC